MDPNNSVIKRLWCILWYSRSFIYDVHDDCIYTEDDEYCYEDVVDALYMGNL